MITYEALKPLDISFRYKESTGYTNMDTFYLTTGDFFFVETGYWGRVPVHDIFLKDDISDRYVETCFLKKIVFKVGDSWEERDDINLFNPLINKSIMIEDALNKGLIAEPVAWKRADKLKELGI